MRKLVSYCEFLMASRLQGYSPNILDLKYLQTNLFLYMYIYNNIDNKNLVENMRFPINNIQSHQEVNIVLVQQHPNNMLRT